MSRAVFPGSFDPVTNGHVDLIRRAAEIFDELVLGVLVNSGKEPLLTTEERIGLLEQVTGDIPNVQVASFDGLLIDFVDRMEADVIVRGLRTPADYEYELPLAQANYRLNRKADTVFLATAPEYSYISSSGVKELLRYQGDISQMVPACVAGYMKEKLNT